MNADFESKFLNADCMEVMREYPDNFFDLAIVDPPYGAANPDSTRGGRTLEPLRRMVQPVQNRIERTGGRWAKKYGKKIIAWDTAPGKEYFDELFRVSRNQIIWGGNYFSLPPTRCFIVWEKLSISEGFSMAMAEYAWTSFFDNAKIFAFAPQGNKEKRFHPTQKPVELYRWLLERYAKPGDIILDTHVGSASSLIACHETGHKYLGCEIDKHYYDKAKKRLEEATSQTTIYEYLHSEGGERNDVPG